MAADEKAPMGSGGGKEEAKTTIDALPELLRQKGRMELSKLAAALNVSEAIAEDWAKILEAGGMVRIIYEMGKMYIELSEGSSGGQSGGGARPGGGSGTGSFGGISSGNFRSSGEPDTVARLGAEAQKEAIESDVLKQRGTLDSFSQRLGQMSTSVNTDEAAFRGKLPQIQANLDAINKIYTALLAESQKEQTVVKSVQDTYNTINARINELYTKIDTFSSANVDKSKAEMMRIQNSMGKAAELESQFTLLTKSKDKALAAIRKSVELQIKELEKEERDAEKSINAQLADSKEVIDSGANNLRELVKSTGSIEEQIAQFYREKERAKKNLEQAKVQFNDEYARIYNSMKGLDDSLKNESKKLATQLDSLKGNFGSAAKTYDSIQEMKSDIVELRKRVTDLQTEALAIQQELKDMDAARMTQDAKLKKVAALKKKKDDMEGETSDLEDKMNKMESRMGAGATKQK